MFWDENTRFPQLSQRGHSKIVVRVPSPAEELEEQRQRMLRALKRIAGKLCDSLRRARPDAHSPFTCELKREGDSLLCLTNGLYNVRLVPALNVAPLGIDDAAGEVLNASSNSFPQLLVELNTRFWNSREFGGRIPTFNKQLNALPQRNRLAVLVDAITQHLPG